MNKQNILMMGIGVFIVATILLVYLSFQEGSNHRTNPTPQRQVTSNTTTTQAPLPQRSVQQQVVKPVTPQTGATSSSRTISVSYGSPTVISVAKGETITVIVSPGYKAGAQGQVKDLGNNTFHATASGSARFSAYKSN